MVFCEISADGCSAIISGFALLATIYTLWSTRKDSNRIQLQVDSLAKMAKLYQSARRDEINPFFTFDDTTINAYNNYISFHNTGKTAYEFIVLEAEFLNIYKVISFEPPENVIWNQVVRLYFPYDISIMNKIQSGQYEFKALIQFKNKDKEVFTQRIHRKINGYNTSYPPEEQ